MKLIVGLGNIGKEYERTWHNLGFLVINEMTSDDPINCSGCRMSKKFKAEIIEASWHGEKVLLVKPQTYMNNSGESVGALARYHKVKPEDIWVIHDEIDIPLGCIRISYDASAGGHKGVKSIIETLCSQKFLRFRVGIAPKRPLKIPTEHYVLKKIGKNDMVRAEIAIKETIEALETTLTDGMEKSMNKYNSKK